MSASKEPRVGCGAAVINSDGELLLVRRLKTPELGHWGLPGGKVDWMETVEIAVVRELQEELGISVELDELICVVNQVQREEDCHWIAPTYLVRRWDGAPEIQEPHKHADLGWFSLDALPSPLTIATKSTVERLKAKEQ